MLVEKIAYNLEQGNQVMTIANGTSNLEAARRESPDPITLKIMVPEMDLRNPC